MRTVTPTAVIPLPVTPPKEPDWMQSLQAVLLMLVLMIATAYRFHGIDNAGLWGAELINASHVANTGWISMVSSLMYKEVEPPGYLTLLYLQYEILGNSEFALRFLSALAGIGSVLMLVLLGKRCQVPQAGFLAAILLAGAPFAVSYSQEAQPYSLFTFFILAQCYAFLGLFVTSDDNDPSGKLPLDIHFNSGMGMFSIQWNPLLPVNFLQLAGFWVSTLLMQSLSYACVGILLAEIIICLIWIKRNPTDELRQLFRLAFTPALVAYVLWLPISVAHFEKIWPLISFGKPLDVDVSDVLDAFFGYSEGLHIAVSFCLAIGIGRIVWVCFISTDKSQCLPLQRVFQIGFSYAVLLLALSFSGFSFQFIPLLLVFQPLAFLVAASAIFVPWQNDRSNVASWIILIVLMIYLCFSQLSANYKSGVFSAERKPDVRSLMKFIAADAAFLQNGDYVFSESIPLDYYLDRYEISRNNFFTVGSLKEQTVESASSYMESNQFYFIDTVNKGEDKVKAELLSELFSRYGAMCVSRTKYFVLVKFSKVFPSGDIAGLEDCGSKVAESGGIL